jgi:hypothetical protein
MLLPYANGQGTEQFHAFKRNWFLVLLTKTLNPPATSGFKEAGLLGLIPSAATQYTSCIKISYSIPTCEGRRRCWKLDERTPKDLGGKHDCREKFWSLKFVGRFGEVERQASVC